MANVVGNLAGSVLLAGLARHGHSCLFFVVLLSCGEVVHPMALLLSAGCTQASATLLQDPAIRVEACTLNRRSL